MNNISRERFLRWLGWFEDHEPVGHTRDRDCCPLARCFTALHPHYMARVDADTITVTEPQPRYALPRPPVVIQLEQWQQALIANIDELSTVEQSRVVIAGEVRAIIEAEAAREGMK